MLQPSLLDDTPSAIRRAAIAGVVLLVLGIIGYRIAAFVAPPLLRIEQPTNLLTTTSRMIEIRGATAPGAMILINGQAFTPDARGGFTANVVLTPGTHTIELEARTRHSRTARVVREVRVIAAEGPVAIRN